MGYEIYLYTLMTLAWDLDKDTHSHFRRYQDVFINQRKISKDLKAIVMDPSVQIYLSKIHPNSLGAFNELRINLPNRVFAKDYAYSFSHLSTPVLIEDLHPPKYYHTARKLSAPSRPHTNP